VGSGDIVTVAVVRALSLVVVLCSHGVGGGIVVALEV
jgi:hypothetical protein